MCGHDVGHQQQHDSHPGQALADQQQERVQTQGEPVQMISFDCFLFQTSLASCVMCGCKRGHVDCVRMLISDTRVPLDITNKAGVSLLQVTDNQEIVKMIQTEQNNRKLSMK